MRADPDVATLPRRVIAGTVDGVLMVTGWVGIVWVAGGGPPSPPNRRIVALLSWGLRGLAVVLRNVRTPGQRLAGVRRVDARDGRAISVRAAITRQLVDLALSRVVRPFIQDRGQRAEPAQPVPSAAPPASEDGRHIEGTTIEMDCLTPALKVGVTLGAHGAVALASPRRQSLTDRLARTVLIREPRR